MRRIGIYGAAIALVIGCKSAERRGSENGCEEGTQEGRAAGMRDRAACEEPAPVPTGCNVQNGGTFRRDKYRDAFEGAFVECYEEAYLEQWTYGMWQADCPTADSGWTDTGTDGWFDGW